MLGYFDDAQSVFSAYSRVYQRKMATFYYGLMLFSDSSSKYFDALNEFSNTIDSNSYTDEIYVAKKLLLYRNSFTLNDYKTLVDDKNIPDYYKTLIHQRAFKQFKNNCEPFLLFGVLQSSIKNYSAAIQFLESGENCKMGAEQAEYWIFHYAYALYVVGEKEKALVYFKPLMKSNAAFTNQAAKYFTAKKLLEQKNIAEARKLLSEIVLAKQTTKYMKLAKGVLKN